jgi:serine/threonine protein kinase
MGEGAHGVVLKAKCLDTQKSVALKRIPLKNVEEPIPISILREISTLRTIHHPNVKRERGSPMCFR